MIDQPRQILIKILTQHDISYFRDSNHFRNLLNDFFKGQNKKESRILTDSFKQKIPHDLIEKKNIIPYEILSDQLVYRLVEYGFASDLAKWAVDTWGISLKIIKEEDLSPKTALLFVRSNPPNAELFFNDENLGKTPKELTNISQGTHEVKIVLNGYHTWEDRIDILKDQKLTINANLIKEQISSVAISLDSSPKGASVYIDGNYRGLTPLKIPDCLQGTHQVKCDLKGYDIQIKTVIFSSVSIIHFDLKKSVDPVLKKNPSTTIPKKNPLTIITNPPGAFVSLNGHQMGKTPLTISLPYELYDLKCSLDGYKDADQHIKIPYDSSLTITLKPKIMFSPAKLYNSWFGKIAKWSLLLLAGLMVFSFISMTLSNISNPVTVSNPPQPDNAAQSYDNALKLLDQKKYEEALIAFDNALAIDPTNANAWTNKGNLLAYLNRSNEAVFAYTKALSINPNLQSAIDGRDQVQQKVRIANLAQIKKDSLTQISELIEGGEALADEGKYQEAINSYDQGLALIGNYQDIEKVGLEKRLLSLKVFSLNKLGRVIEANKIAQTISHL